MQSMQEQRAQWLGEMFGERKTLKRHLRLIILSFTAALALKLHLPVLDFRLKINH
jgi:hypothetical protein